jgi:hypothetical protein
LPVIGNATSEAPSPGAQSRPHSDSDLRCPLCAGPLAEENLDHFVCAVGHGLSRDELRQAANYRATVALWMAIEALRSEAEALRRLTAGAGDDPRWRAMADQADEDADLLRNIARLHDPLAE